MIYNRAFCSIKDLIDLRASKHPEALAFRIDKRRRGKEGDLEPLLISFEPSGSCHPYQLINLTGNNLKGYKAVVGEKLRLLYGFQTILS
jgi:hypothetical protein